MPDLLLMEPSPAPAPSPDPIEAWVRRHQGGAWRFLRFLGCDSNIAQDLLQTALLAAVQAGIPGGPEARAAAWLRSTVRNLYFGHLRAAGRRPATGELTDVVQAEAAFVAFHGNDGSSLAVDALRECLGLLGPRARQGVDLFYGDGASRQDVAHELGITVEGVKTLLRRSRDELRACVESKKERL